MGARSRKLSSQAARAGLTSRSSAIMAARAWQPSSLRNLLAGEPQAVEQRAGRRRQYPRRAQDRADGTLDRLELHRQDREQSLLDVIERHVIGHHADAVGFAQQR